MSLLRPIVLLVAAASLLFLPVIPAHGSSCDSTHARPSVQEWPVALEDTLDFGLHAISKFQDQTALIHNAGYGDLIPGYDVALYSRTTVTLNGNACIQGHVHADSGIIGPEHIVCEGTWDSGQAVDPPPAFTHPDSFPGATYYYVEANDGPGNQDTLFIKDRNWQTLQFYIRGVSVPDSPHPDFDWSYDRRNGGVLYVDFAPVTNALDQVTGAFPRVGADFTVVVNFGGLSSYMKHDKTNLFFQESGNFVIQSTIINTRYSSAAGTSTAERLNSSNWSGGALDIAVKSVFEPLYCVAFIVQAIDGNAFVEIGTADDPAVTYITQNADLSIGQWTIQGSLWSLGDVSLGGGVNLAFNGDFDECVPPPLRPCRRELEVLSATITGPDASRFSLRDFFQPFFVGEDPTALPVQFRDDLATPGRSYEATLTLASRDAGDPGGANLEDLTWRLSAGTAPQDGFQLPCVWSGHSIHLTGNVCVEGVVFASQSIHGEQHLSCGTLENGYQIELPPLRTAPERFPGATYYYVEANDGPGRRDTLFIKDRNWQTIHAFISGESEPASPHPDFRWSYDPELGGVLSIEIGQTSEVLDQETGPFRRLGSDSTVVINFGGLGSYMRHSRTSLILRDNDGGEASSLQGPIRSTVINTRHCCIGITWQLLDPTYWDGGRTLLRGRVQFAPTLGLALLVHAIEGGSQVDIGIPGRPALTYVTGNGNFSSGQASLRGQLIALGDLHLGGGFDAVCDTGFEDDLPGWITYAAPTRLDVPEGFTSPEKVLPTAGISSSNSSNVVRTGRVTPNPFRSAVSIEFNLAQPGPASLSIFDAQGRLIRSLLDREMTAGAHSVTWDGKTDRGLNARSGLYFARLLSAGTSMTRRLVRLE